MVHGAGYFLEDFSYLCRDMDRIEKEKSVVALMLRHYCHRYHTPDDDNLCADCDGLMKYAMERLSHCRWGNSKPSCRKCPIHCYAPARREEIRRVMRVMGPKMLFIDPLAAIAHAWREMRPTPQGNRRGRDLRDS